MNCYSTLAIPVFAFLMVFVLVPLAKGEELKVLDPATGARMEARVLKDVDQTFPSSVKKIYAATRIVGATTDTFIIHKWYYGDRLMAEVRLPVLSPSWRTFSSKNIIP